MRRITAISSPAWSKRLESCPPIGAIDCRERQNGNTRAGLAPSTRFSYGDDIGYTNLSSYAWYDGNSYTTNKPPGTSYYVTGRYYTTHPVGQKPPNLWG